MTNKKQKFKAVLLTMLMVTSVFAATIAFSGAAAASDRGAGDTYTTGPTDSNTNNAASAGNVGAGATIFQGEEDIEGSFATGTSTPDVPLANLEKTSGDDEGVLLGSPIAQDQSTGTYSANPGVTGAESVTLQTPRISDVEVQNSQNGDVTGSILQTGQGNGEVLVDYNYESAEDVEITVEDEDGLDVTEEIVVDETALNPNNNAGTAGSNFDVGFELDPNGVDEGEYTITVEGVEDLDFGEATETVTVTISDDRTASLNIESDQVVQGENVRFDIEDSPEGNFHAVVIEPSDFRDDLSNLEYARIMRNVGDTSDAGLVVDTSSSNDVTLTASEIEASGSPTITDVKYAYAIVEIDGGTGVGSIESQYLDDSSIDVDLYEASASSGSAPANYVNGGDHINADLTAQSVVETDDEPDFEVTEGELSLESPSGSYITGSEVDINGTATPGADEVALYVRDNGDFQLIAIDGDATISVDGDDTFSEEDIDLSSDVTNANGNDILSLPGTYRVGVIDAQDADVDSSGPSFTSSSDVDATLTTSEFNSGVSSTNSLRVTDTALNGSFTTYNGQIASEDGQIDVDGQAPGKSDVVVAFVDSRGNAEATVVSVDEDDTFSEDDLQLDFGASGARQDLAEGTVTAHIISSGRDGQFGDTGLDEQQLATAISSDGNAATSASGTTFAFSASSSTGNQVRDRILENTVDDTASDDIIVNEQFRLSDGLTTVDTVNSPVSANGTIEVEGSTNRIPDDNTITVELLDNEDESVTLTDTDQWSSDGQWTVSIDLSDTDVEPGNYTVEADDGSNTDRASVQIVEPGSIEEEQPETDTPEPETDTPEPETDTPEPETDTPEPETDTPEPETDTEMQTEMETEEATTEASGPGFTAAIALIALVAAALLAVRRDN
jgi:major cell surface glycoprotein (TIGR04216 family)